MKNIFFCIFTFLLLVLISLHLPGSIEGGTINRFKEIITTNQSIHYNLLNDGWFEEKDGIKILHLQGTFYEMGYQLGYFLKYEIIRNLRGFGLTENISELWNIQKNYISNESIDYIQGTADAIGLSFDDVGCIWIWERNCSLHCSSVIADGPATKSNEIIHVYSLDFPDRPKDPITGICVLGDPVLIVAKPENGHAFMYPSFAGYVVESGVNEKGIVISNTASPCKDENDYGAPVGIRIFEALFQASNLEEAVDIINKNTTYGYNFLISDVNKNTGYILEQTANLSYLGIWNDTSESEGSFYQLNHILRRTNCFINTETSATQRKYYDLKDLRYLLHFNLWPRYEWYRYKAISNGYQKYSEDLEQGLDLTSALFLIRNVYLGKYGGIIWYIIKNIVLRKANSWYQWSYSPKTGDMLICYASQDKVASKNPINHFNFFELLEREPPN